MLVVYYAMASLLGAVTAPVAAAVLAVPCSLNMVGCTLLGANVAVLWVALPTLLHEPGQTA
jgi:hypothetical protein